MNTRPAGHVLATAALLFTAALAALALSGGPAGAATRSRGVPPRVVVGPPGGGPCAGGFVNVMFQTMSNGSIVSESWCEDGQIAANPPGAVDTVDNQSSERFWIKGHVWLVDSFGTPYTAAVDVCISPGMDWIFEDVISSPVVGTGAASPCPSDTWPSSVSNYGIGEQWYLNDCPNTYLNRGGPDFIMVAGEIGRAIGVQPFCYPPTAGNYAGSSALPVWAMANGTPYRVWVENSSKQTYCISPHTVVQLVPAAFANPVSVGVSKNTAAC